MGHAVLYKTFGFLVGARKQKYHDVSNHPKIGVNSNRQLFSTYISTAQLKETVGNAEG